jgi:hypothetical protein|tara:strand:+ start:596 stop:1015 length:420 start_codon:yes stop_codon:yes gene_type:complete
MKDKDKVLDHLMRHLPAEAMKKPGDMDYVKDTEMDYGYAREKLKELIEKGGKAIDTMMDLAQDAEHPRAFEVLSGMLKHSSEMTMELMKLQSERKKLNDAKEEKTEITNNSLFLGSTSELQKFLTLEKEKVIIDAESSE